MELVKNNKILLTRVLIGLGWPQARHVWPEKL